MTTIQLHNNTPTFDNFQHDHPHVTVPLVPRKISEENLTRPQMAHRSHVHHMRLEKSEANHTRTSLHWTVQGLKLMAIMVGVFGTAGAGYYGIRRWQKGGAQNQTNTSVKEGFSLRSGEFSYTCGSIPYAFVPCMPIMNRAVTSKSNLHASLGYNPNLVACHRTQTCDLVPCPPELEGHPLYPHYDPCLSYRPNSTATASPGNYSNQDTRYQAYKNGWRPLSGYKQDRNADLRACKKRHTFEKQMFDLSKRAEYMDTPENRKEAGIKIAPPAQIQRDYQNCLKTADTNPHHSDPARKQEACNRDKTFQINMQNQEQRVRYMEDRLCPDGFFGKDSLEGINEDYQKCKEAVEEKYPPEFGSEPPRHNLTDREAHKAQNDHAVNKCETDYKEDLERIPPSPQSNFVANGRHEMKVEERKKVLKARHKKCLQDTKKYYDTYGSFKKYTVPYKYLSSRNRTLQRCTKS
jgi:hypothetical protein